MANANWKHNERRAAAALGGRRFPANSGYKIDCHSPLFIAQVKRVKHISLPALERLAVQAQKDAEGYGGRKIHGVVALKRTGGMAPMLFVMTEETMRLVRNHLEIHCPDVVKGWELAFGKREDIPPA